MFYVSFFFIYAVCLIRSSANKNGWNSKKGSQDKRVVHDAIEFYGDFLRFEISSNSLFF